METWRDYRGYGGKTRRLYRSGWSTERRQVVARSHGSGIPGGECSFPIVLCCVLINHGTRYEVVDVNLKGVLFTAQAAGRQMARFDNGGSIIMVASICGSVAVDVRRI